MKYEYANITDAELAELNALQEKLSKDGKKLILLAVEEPYQPATLNEEELNKITALEKELSAAGHEVVLVGLSK